MAGYVVRIALPDRPGALGLVASRIGAVGGDIVAINILDRDEGHAVDATVAKAYGLTRNQYAHVLQGFSHRSHPEAPALCLAAFDRRQAEIDRSNSSTRAICRSSP